MPELVISLGSNLGQRQLFLEKAIEMLSEKWGAPILLSSIYETSPWGMENAQSFLNQITVWEVDADPLELLSRCLDVERMLGRRRYKDGVYHSRTMDLDILFYGHAIAKAKDLQIPHPRLHERRFILEPLNEILPTFVHPELNRSVQDLLNDSHDQSEIHLWDYPTAT